MSDNVLAIIPARGGSKGIPRKNLVELAGRPLIAYTLDAVNLSQLLDAYVVSTDDEEIASVTRRFGGSVPYLRPKNLAQDDTNIIDVVNEVIQRPEYGLFKYLLLLQPTAPLRLAADIDASIELALSHDADSVIGFMKVDSFHPWYMYYLEGKTVRPVVPTKPGMRRQDFPEAVWRNGAIYLVKTQVFKEKQTFITENSIPYVMPEERSVNIDSEEDLRRAEYLLRHYAVAHH